MTAVTLLQPGEQPAQFGAEDGVVLQPREQRFDGVEDHALGADAANRKGEPDEQSLEIVLAGLLDLAALDADVVDRQLLLVDQGAEVEAERRHVTRHLLGVLFEGEEHAGLVELQRAIHQEGERQQGLAGSRPTADERRPVLRQSAAGDFVEAADAGQCFRELTTRREFEWHAPSVTAHQNRCCCVLDSRQPECAHVP